VSEPAVTSLPASGDPAGASARPYRHAVSKTSIQTAIQASLSQYPPSMKRVADVILNDPQMVLEETISEVARACATSETTIVRFCRTLGFAGFAPLRLALAAELATEERQFGADRRHGADIRPTDTLAQAVEKITNAEIMGIQETAAAQDMTVLGAIVQRMSRAEKILSFGVGASGLAAQDLTQKILRIGRIAIDFRDAHDALSSAALLGRVDVAIAFSHSGRTKEAVEFLRVARRSGAFTVAVTNTSDSPLVEHADGLLRTAVREMTLRSGAMASRTAQMTLVDYLFAGLARERYTAAVAALGATYDAVRALRDDR
jgi:DNA-binding MurR/RpiR family transcriptional regulator